MFTDIQAVAPVQWVRHTPWTQGLSQVLQTQQPAVLVLSLPRSGSSWTGEALGCAPDALYLREPVTQSDRQFHNMGTVFPIDRPDLDARYRWLADRAYAGWPDFDRCVVRFPERWNLANRSTCRVVIKEVNPLACGWHIDRYAPRVIFLVRHPAAVALSWQRKGWLLPDAGSWAMNGDVQGRALRTAFDSLAQHTAHTVISYEELCADPVGTFKTLYGFAGLTWDFDAARFITDRIHKIDGANTWDTSRHSQEMIRAWQNDAVPSHLAALRESFRRFNLPWYCDDQDWELG